MSFFNRSVGILVTGNALLTWPINAALEMRSLAFLFFPETCPESPSDLMQTDPTQNYSLKLIFFTSFGDSLRVLSLYDELWSLFRFWKKEMS